MRKFLFNFILTGIITFTILLGICFFGAYLVLSKAPFQITIKSVPSISSILELKSTIDEEYKFISSGNSSYERKITLTKDQINSAFNLYLSANQIARIMNKSESQNRNLLELRGGSYEKGIFTLFFSQKLPFETFLGDYLNIRLEAALSIENNELKIKVADCRVGSLTLPSVLINYILKEKDPRINNLKEVKLLLGSVKRIILQDDSVTIVYNPEKLLKFISAYSGNIKF